MTTTVILLLLILAGGAVLIFNRGQLNIGASDLVLIAAIAGAVLFAVAFRVI